MSAEPTCTELLALAEAAARAAGEHALANEHRRLEVHERDDHDVKLQLDLECQRVAVETIHAVYPDHAIIGEEGRVARADTDTEWIIDPIDGTVNFTHTMPLWCSSVAVRRRGEVVAGAVFVPPLNEMYTAALDGPALCNGKPIRPSEVDRLDHALLLTGVSKKVGRDSAVFDDFRTISLAVQKVRVMGAAAIDICHVACGRADAYVESSIYLWDVAAAGLIARRAGARTEVFRQYDDLHMYYVCTNGKIHDETIALLGSP